MISSRPKLSLPTRAQPSEEDRAALLRDAMERRVQVSWTYNRTRMQVAPEILYMRNDSLHCDATIMERKGEKLAERKLGAFKLAGLRDIALGDEPFTPATDIPADDVRYQGGILARAIA